MIEEELKEILENVFGGADNGDYLEAISQIKSLVIQSLGKEKTTTDIEPTIGTLSPINYGQNLHISEMKKKWK